MVPTPLQIHPSQKKPTLTLSFSSAVAKIDAIQAEYSAFETLHETDNLISTARELNIAYVAYSPLGHGWLVDDGLWMPRAKTERSQGHVETIALFATEPS